MGIRAVWRVTVTISKAQAYEGLEDVRYHLRFRTHMYKNKNRHIVGQGANTISQNLINPVQGQRQCRHVHYSSQRLTTLSGSLGEFQWRDEVVGSGSG
jgi:hypothetical protein